jgi:hypothetical protein
MDSTYIISFFCIKQFTLIEVILHCFLGVLRTLAWVKNILMAHLCLSVTSFYVVVLNLHDWEVGGEWSIIVGELDFAWPRELLFLWQYQPTWPGVIIPTEILNLLVAGEGSLYLLGCSTCVTWGDISARMIWDTTITTVTCVSWYEEHFWNLTVLQRICFSNLVTLILVTRDIF